MFDFFKISIMNLIYLLGGFIGFGLLFDKIETLNNKLILSTFGRMGIIITGSIGTVVHELSHLIMCLLFGHKVTEVKLFRPISAQTDGVLGYIRHSYNERSIYQSIGSFFTGIAPLIGGTITIVLLFKFLLPNTYSVVVSNINLNDYINYLNEFKILEMFKLLLTDISFVLKQLFFNTEVFSLRYLLFTFSMYSISTHMSLSRADLEGCISGIIVIFTLVMIFTFVTMFFNISTSALSGIIIKYNVFVVLFMLIGLVFSLLTLAISYLLSLIL